MVAPTTNWVTLSGSPSGSLSLVSTLPLAAVSSAVLALSATGVGASFAVPVSLPFSPASIRSLSCVTVSWVP